MRGKKGCKRHFFPRIGFYKDLQTYYKPVLSSIDRTDAVHVALRIFVTCTYCCTWVELSDIQVLPCKGLCLISICTICCPIRAPASRFVQYWITNTIISVCSCEWEEYASLHVADCKLFQFVSTCINFPYVDS